MGEYSDSGSTSEKKIVIGYPVLAGEICVVNREFSDLQWLMNTMYSAFKTTPVHCLLEFFFFLEHHRLSY